MGKVELMGKVLCRWRLDVQVAVPRSWYCLGGKPGSDSGSRREVGVTGSNGNTCGGECGSDGDSRGSDRGQQ
eukprot:10812747-Lingulodinium_polyedra.AAC.1